MVIVRFFLIISFIWLQYSLWIGKNGIRDYINIRNCILMRKLNNDSLRKNNNQLLSDIEALKNDLGIIEEYARNELGMIKSNETFYRFY